MNIDASLQINQYLQALYTLGTGALGGNRESTLNNEQVLKINAFHLIIWADYLKNSIPHQ